MKYTISVIVPCYNVEKYIARCLDSLVTQKIEVPYEIVVVDDGTKDRSALIAEEYVKKYPNLVRLLHKQNGGLSSARNYGIENSYSDYLAFVDSDDYVSKDFLSTLYNLSVRDNADISMCGVIRTKDSSGKGSRFDSGFTEESHNIDCLTLIQESSFAAWNKLYKRIIFQNERYPEGINYEDFALTPRLFFKSNRVSYIHKSCYYYFDNSSSIIGSMAGKADMNILKAFEILAQSEISKETNLLEILFIRRVVLSLTKTLIQYGYKQKQIESIETAIKQYVPDIIGNNFIKNLNSFDRLYTMAFLSRKYNFCKLMMKSYSVIYKVYKTVKNI